jgi:hypothetical protein
VRVALTGFRWPLDPALARGRDESTLARALYATPLRTDPASGAVLPGLCTAWTASAGFRRWTVTCRSAPAIGAALRRVARLRDAPARWLFAAVRRVTANATTLFVSLRFPWRRFPYALTAVGAAPRTVAGPFELVRGSGRRVLVRGASVRVEFRRLGARDAVRDFRLGRLDEAPIPVGDQAFVGADPQLGAWARTRTLLGLDVASITGFSRRFRRAYWQTANRADYEKLVPELTGAKAYGFLGGERASPAEYRRAVRDIPSLRPARVRFGVPIDPALRYGAGLLYAQWRDLGLGVRLVSTPKAKVHAGLHRLIAAYPQEEALPAELVLGYGLGPRDMLLRALRVTRQRDDLQLLDDEMRGRAAAIPIAWVVDARLVSPRLDGWREDALGNVDYTLVRARASSRRR